MATKKKQHIIPQCYLRAFSDPVPPKGVSIDDYKPAIWLNDKNFGKPPFRKGVKKALQKSYFYNLKNDDKKHPKIETFFGAIEGNYASVLRRIVDNKHLTASDVIKLTVFIDTLYRRTEENISFWQDTFEKVERMFRDMDYFFNNNEKHSDEYWKESSEISKKFIPDHTGVMTEVLLDAGISIVVNKSELPFFTSDKPVTHTFCHIDELHNVDVPKSWTYKDIGTNQEKFYCFCPLTPKHAFVSSHFITPPDNGMYRETTDINFVINMNYMMQSHADKFLISSCSQPYGKFHESMLETIKIVTSQYQEKQKGEKAKIYTDRSRFEIAISKYKSTLEPSPISRVEFCTNELDKIKLMATHDKVNLLEYYVDGKEREGSRRLKFQYISLYKDEPSILVGDY